MRFPPIAERRVPFSLGQSCEENGLFAIAGDACLTSEGLSGGAAQFLTLVGHHDSPEAVGERIHVCTVPYIFYQLAVCIPPALKCLLVVDNGDDDTTTR